MFFRETPTSVISFGQLCQELGVGVCDSVTSLRTGGHSVSVYSCLLLSLRSVLWQVTLVSDTAFHLKHFVGLVHKLLNAWGEQRL